MVRRFLLLAGVLSAMAACGDGPSESPAETTRGRLVGTWMRSYEEAGTRVRRVLVLEEPGGFRELSVATRSDGQPPIESSASGDWLFDGTNLKRRYRLINGKPLSAPTIPFATFEVRFSGKSEFIGIDHVRKLEVHYERVADGTRP